MREVCFFLLRMSHLDLGAGLAFDGVSQRETQVIGKFRFPLVGVLWGAFEQHGHRHQ